MTIGNKIKQRRKALGMSVDELARRIGKDRSTIYRYESGDIESIPVAILDPIGQALDIEPRYFLGWDEQDNIGGYICDDSGVYTKDQWKAELTAWWFSHTGDHRWSKDEQQIILQCAQYMMAAKHAPDYDDKIKLLNLFFEQLNT